jgi:hypothetical protein
MLERKKWKQTTRTVISLNTNIPHIEAIIPGPYIKLKKIITMQKIDFWSYIFWRTGKYV